MILILFINLLTFVLNHFPRTHLKEEAKKTIFLFGQKKANCLNKQQIVAFSVTPKLPLTAFKLPLTYFAT